MCDIVYTSLEFESFSLLNTNKSRPTGKPNRVHATPSLGWSTALLH